MNAKKQRDALKEAAPAALRVLPTMGWQYYSVELNVWNEPIGWVSCFCNDPLKDLNAMHEVEKVLTDGQYSSDNLASYEDTSFIGWLYRIMVRRVEEPNFRTHSATAAQRAEALLRTIGKWEEGK